MVSSAELAGDRRVAAAWSALAALEDPEIPGLLLRDLGLIRFVRQRADGVLEVGLSPTYTGCPATEVIRASVEQALIRAELGPAVVQQALAPAWSSDWITPQGRRTLLALGIVPPPEGAQAHRLIERAPLDCPHCRSRDTECVSEFGSTPCKALHRCRACLEPFEAFKCI